MLTDSKNTSSISKFGKADYISCVININASINRIAFVRSHREVVIKIHLNAEVTAKLKLLAGFSIKGLWINCECDLIR